MTDTDDQPRGDQRLRVWLEAALRDEDRLPEAITRPATYRDIWGHARRGSWTTRDEHSAVRIPATIWAAGAILVTATGEVIKWAITWNGSPIKAIRNPRTPAEIWEHARSSSSTSADSEVKQRAATVRAVVATVPAIAIDLVAWSTQRFTRFAVVTTSAVLIGTGIAQIPVIGELVPTIVNITAW